MSRSWTAVLLALLALFIALAIVYRKPTAHMRTPGPWWKASTPFPDDCRIEPPGRDIPDNAATLSGIWEGQWDLGDGRYLPTTIAVERIEPGRVSAIYSWGTAPWNPPSSMAPNWLRVTGRLEGETIVLHWGAPPEDFTVTLRLKEEDRAFAEYAWTSYRATAVLERAR